MIKWDDAYATGLTLIDEQHKNLFQYLNDLESAVTENEVSDALFLDALEYFEKYIKVHFGNEETCMHRYRCPTAQINQKAHQRFILFFNDYKTRLQNQGTDYQLFREMLDFCEQWILQHICKIDTQLKSCVEKKEIGKELSGL